MLVEITIIAKTKIHIDNPKELNKVLGELELNPNFTEIKAKVL